MLKKAPQVGLEPTTLRLTAGCSAIELLRSNGTDGAVFTGVTQRGYQSPKGRVNGSRLGDDPVPASGGLLNDAGDIFLQQIALHKEVVRRVGDAGKVVFLVLVSFLN